MSEKICYYHAISLCSLILRDYVTFMGFFFMLVAGGIAGFLLKDMGSRAAEFGMLVMALVFVLEIPVGIVTMPLGMIAGLLAVAGLGWAFFGRRSG